MDINWMADRAGIAQIYSQGLEYAFVSEDGRQCHPFVYCKDFLQDAVWGQLHNKAAGIYGFSFNPAAMPPVYLERFTILLRFNRRDTFPKEIISNTLPLLHMIEKVKGYEPCTIDSVGKFQGTGSEVFLLSADKRWLHAPPLLSFYTLAIRVGLTYDGSTLEEFFSKVKDGKVSCLSGNDRSYTTSALKITDKLLKTSEQDLFGGEMAKNYPPGINISSLHNSTGVVASSGGSKGIAGLEHWKL